MTDVRAGIGESGGKDDSLTIDELAARTGMTVRTVRFYATQGLLPAPERRGRVGYYSSRHRVRLELIRTLQEHGYTLAAIDRVLARIPADASAAEYAVQAAVLAPWLPDEDELISRADIDRRAGRVLSDEELEYLEAATVLRAEGDGYRTATSTLGHALALMDLPVPTRLLHASMQLIDEHAAAVANGLTELFIDSIWGPYQRGEIDDQQVLDMLSRLRPLAVHGLVSSFGRAADRAARRRIDQTSPDRAAGTTDHPAS